jgi:hypothetical protein
MTRTPWRCASFGPGKGSKSGGSRLAGAAARTLGALDAGGQAVEPRITAARWYRLTPKKKAPVAGSDRADRVQERTSPAHFRIRSRNGQPIRLTTFVMLPGDLGMLISALGQRRPLPRTLTAERWLVVLVCYLDDSGKDPQNPIETVAGYIGKDHAWQAFETEIEPIFAEKKVTILHAKELHDTDGDFKGWSRLQKQAFLARIGLVAARHLMMGFSMSALKGSYQEHAAYRAEGTPSRRTVTSYTFCFQVIVDWILRGVQISRAAHNEGVAFVLECGHENNSQAKDEFHWVQQHYSLENVLRSISFVPKASCRAIQYADLAAFYTRRDSIALWKAQTDSKETYEMDVMLKILLESCPHRGFVATGFHTRPPA